MQHNTRSLRRRLTALAAASAVVPATVALSLAAPASAAAAPAPAAPAVTKIEGAAANAAGLQPTVDAYRGLLGNPDNLSAPGSQPSGRREINWDGVPDNRAAPNLLPADFFNTTVTRGAVFASSNANKFQVSADSENPTNTPVRFGDINPQYANIFATFSPPRLFTPLGTNKTIVRFFEPGSHRRATVNGFGAVFTDVDKADSTKIEFYDQWGNQIYWRNVPKGPTAQKSLSFLGVKTTAAIYEVRITTGNAPLSAHNTDNHNRDLVVMDDFLYGEPKPLH